MKEKRKKVLLGISVLFVITLLIGVSYAYWKLTFEQREENVVTSDCFQIEFLEGESINLDKAYPMSKEEGLKTKGYTFTLKNVCDSYANYQINVESLEESGKILPDEYIRASLSEGEVEKATTRLLSEKETEVSIQGARKAYKLYEGMLSPKEEKEFKVRLWMDESTPAVEESMNAKYRGKVSIVTSYRNQYKESILNGMDPVIKDGLVPVTIDNSGTVRKANIGEKWYSYANQEWANAVILEDESIPYQDGEEIPEDNIESYFVWIPRYKYKLFNLGEYETLTSVDENAVQDIDIVFGRDITDDSREGECTTPMVSGETGNCKVGDYMSHPAFLAFNVNGLWVGKFETGYKGATDNSGAYSNTYDVDKVEIKPNVYSWRGVQVANAHLNSYNYKREYDSHMMKNTEWGAVAYLQHSIYGSRTSVRINNNINCITGYAAVNEPSIGFNGTHENEEKVEVGEDGEKTVNYKNPLSVVASTTNNYTGVYDMSGGTWEYLMGIMANEESILYSGSNSTNHSGFNGPYSNEEGSYIDGINYPEEKYYDRYLYSSNTDSFNRRILGDATGEMGPFGNVNYESEYTRQIGSWYQDEGIPGYTESPWFGRGGSHSQGTGAGVFSYTDLEGGTFSYVGYRIVLAI